ncbi:MAG: GHKL domain-containing protein, partial [Candidatus Brocadiales bacterium]|nr:GHKL domain-containing protein [Candidatus Brocadiales bacterium]
VKNPLSSIKAIVQVLKEDPGNETKTQESLSIIVEEIDRLTKVVNQLLVFAKPQTDSKSTVNINDVISKISVVLRHEAKMNNVIIHQDVSNDLPVITVDEGSLNEVFFNIIYNAIQAMSEGGKLTISMSYDQKEDYITVVFENTGPRISEEDMGKIFEPFYTTKQMGTGLGLAIVKKKLEEIRGMVHVKSEDSFTRFTVKIPSSEGVLVSNI